MDVTRKEILVIAATKCHFDALDSNGYDVARAIIQHVIYGNNARYFENELLVLRTILRKSREWTVEGWDEFLGRIYLKARESNFFATGKLIETDLRDFEDNLIRELFAEVQGLQVWDNGRDIINLDVTDEELEEVRKAVDKFNNLNII